MDLEEKVKEYIRNGVKEDGNLRIPLFQVANDVNSSIATVWRALQKLEKKRIIKVVKPRLKTTPNIIYYIGEEEKLDELVDILMISTENVLILMKSLKDKIRLQQDVIFKLEKKLESKL